MKGVNIKEEWEKHKASKNKPKLKEEKVIISNKEKNPSKEFAKVLTEDVKKFGKIDSDGVLSIDDGIQKQVIGKVKDKELTKTGFKNLMPLEKNRIIRYWKARAKDDGVKITILEDEIILGEDKRIDERILELLEKGKLWDYIILDELDKRHIGDIPAKEVLFLCCIGRLVKNKKPFSFNCLILSPSSSGKDHVVASVLKLFPKEAQEKYGRTSRTTFNYLHSLEEEPNYTYDGKIIYLPEIEEHILNSEIMLEFTSGEDEISEVAIKKQKGAGVDKIQIRGHPEIFTTTAKTIPSDEIRNRFNIVNLDLSEEQIKRSFIQEEEPYNEKITFFLSTLNPSEIKIPKKMFNFIVKNFPSKKQRHKRDFQRLLDFIKVLALFNRREIAEPQDYDRAKDIFINAYSNVSNIPLKDIDNRIVSVLEQTKEPMSAKNITDELGGIITIQNIYPHLRNLVAKEILDELTDRIGGHVINFYALSEEFKDKKPFELPNYDE